MYRLRLLLRKWLRRPTPSVRKDQTIISIQDGLHLEVYWKVLRIGRGPAVILNVFDEEVLKYDCFGQDKGHYHIQLKGPYRDQGMRLYFSENSAREQVLRVAFELEHNAQTYLAMHIRARIRRVAIEPARMQQAVREMQARMLHFLDKVDELQGI